MKKLAYIFLALSALFLGLTACQQKEDPAVSPDEIVDLRYRVSSSYELDAINAKVITIVVKSTKPWTIRSYHPVWCIIEQEDGEAVADSLVHAGKGESTSVKVQYYDNTELDDRIDTLEIASNGYIGKKVTVYQKGIAYLTIPAEQQKFMIPKAGGETQVTIASNQTWSVKLTEIEGDWLSISKGASGQMDGSVVFTAKENPGEKRYATAVVYDRHGVEQYKIDITQDGVQLDPATFEIRVGHDQLASSLSVVSNAKWSVEKGAGEEWFSIDNPDGHDGDDVLKLTFQANSDGTSLRKGSIVLKTVPANPGDPVIEKEIVIKQAYPITPIRHIMNDDELGNWESDWANAPVYTKDYGALFTAKCRLHNGSMPFGTYTFHWKDITPDSSASEGIRVRHWFCFGDGCELKFDIRPLDGKVSPDFNAASDGNKPSLSGYTDVDFSQPIDITYKFDPSGEDYCHVTYLVNGDEACSYDTAANMLSSVHWGDKINMYIGVDKSGSAVLEWYEYTAPMNWDE